jgi:hypothetical protein
MATHQIAAQSPTDDNVIAITADRVDQRSLPRVLAFLS